MRSSDATANADLDACRRIMRRGSKSFSLAALLMPRRMRPSTIALYAFCRVADDVVDAPEGSRVAVRTLERRLDDIFSGRPADDPVDRMLARVVEWHALPREPFDALIEGFVWDVEAHTYETLDEVLAYALRAAGTVGILMTLMLDEREPDVLARACDLGVAMQLTNIARDVGEDLRRGRVYLPAAWLREEGSSRDELLVATHATEPVRRVVARLLSEADTLYTRADLGIPRLPRDARLGIHAARLLYSDLHHQIRRRGMDTITGRAVVPIGRKLVCLARAAQKTWMSRVNEQGTSIPALPGAMALLTAVRP